MAVLIISRGEYRNTDAIDRLTNYVLNPSCCYGGNGVDLCNPAKSMKKMKSICDQTTGKQAEHIILAFSHSEHSFIYTTLLRKIGYEICNFFNNAQVLFSLHECSDTYGDFTTDGYHLHFVINTVNIRNGKKFGLDYSNEFLLKYYILEILKKYDITEKLILIAK